MRADNDRELFLTRLKTGVAARRLTTRWSGHRSAAAPHDSAKANCAFATSSGVPLNSRSLDCSRYLRRMKHLKKRWPLISVGVLAVIIGLGFYGYHLLDQARHEMLESK